jgi:hypothetical protein
MTPPVQGEGGGGLMSYFDGCIEKFGISLASDRNKDGRESHIAPLAVLLRARQKLPMASCGPMFAFPLSPAHVAYCFCL